MKVTRLPLINRHLDRLEYRCQSQLPFQQSNGVARLQFAHTELHLEQCAPLKGASISPKDLSPKDLSPKDSFAQFSTFTSSIAPPFEEKPAPEQVYISAS